MTVISKATAPHYQWGEGCDGWTLNNSSDLSVIHERMPPGTKERRHFHANARQFFFVLNGELAMKLDGSVARIPALSGLEIAPGAVHEARNESEAEVQFLVISSPTTAGDRTEVS